MIKLYLFSKQIHNLLVIIISVIGCSMAVTGIILKFPSITRFLPFINYELSRKVHNQLSLIFTIVFVMMAITGIIMYTFPRLKKRGIN
jgi:hypothetical protein